MAIAINKWYWRYVFRLGNLLNIVEKVTGIDYSCYDIPRTPKVWNVLARNWLQFIQVRNLKWKTYKLETSQSPEYSKRKYCLLLFSLRRSMWFLCQMVMMMTMMMTMIIRESVVRTRDVLGKTARSKVLIVFKNRAVSNCAASAMAASWVKLLH